MGRGNLMTLSPSPGCSSGGNSTVLLKREIVESGVAYSHSHAGIRAAILVGLGVSILPEMAILPDHRVLKTKDGFPAVTNTELALVAAPNASPATRRLAQVLADFFHRRSVRRLSQPTGPRATETRPCSGNRPGDHRPIDRDAPDA